MAEVLDALLGWWRTGASVGVATVVEAWASAPRAPGAQMLLGPDGTVVGSVSGGCVEADVHARLEEVLAGDSGPSLQRYGVSDDEAIAVGLTCGGVLDVFVERVDRSSWPELGQLVADVDAGRAVAVGTVVSHPDRAVLGRRFVVGPDEGVPVSGSLGNPRRDDAATDDIRGLLAAGRNGVLHYGPDGQRRGEGMAVFVASHAPPARMIVFGGTDYAAALARLGAFLGYRVTVCDARPAFATQARFPAAAEVVLDWPHRYLRTQAEAGAVDATTVLCVLTHDPKFDVPLLELALRLPAVGYVGAMGSRRTHERRLAQLRAAGLSPAELGRLSSPIGLDLGARTPEETAVSVAAEIVASRWGHGGLPLRTLDGPIHEPDHQQRQVEARS